MIRRDKFKLSIWILAIISVVLLGNVAFAEEMIPRGVIKSDYVVGDKSTAEHVYYGAIYDIDDDCISVRAQDDFSQKKFELSVSNEELKTHLVDLDEGRILRNNMYRLYLKEDIHDDAELLAIEKVVGEKDCGEYYLSAKVGDRWIFGYGPNRNYNSESNDTHIKYFGLKISEEFLKEYSDYDIDEVFEKFSHIPIKTFIDDDGNLSGFFGDGEKKDIDDCYWYLENEAIMGSEPITILEKNFSNFRASGDSATIDIDDESDVKIELNQDSMDLEGNQKYTGRFLNENGKMILLNVKEIVDDTKDDDDMDLKGELDDCKNIVFIKGIDDGEVEYIMIEATRGYSDIYETDSSNLDGEFYVLDRADMNGEKLSDSYEKVRKENLNIETGQIIYTELEYIHEIEDLNENSHVILKNSPKYHVNSGENFIKRLQGEGFYEKEYLKIEDNDLIDLKNLEMVMVLDDDKWEYFDGDDVLKYYNIDSEFDCTLIRSPIKTDQVVGILFENLAKKAEYSSKMMGKVSDIKDYKDYMEMSVDLAGKIHKFKGYKDKIDLSEIESNDLVLVYYQNGEILGYRILDEDDIEEKIVYLDRFGDDGDLTFEYCDVKGYSSDFEVLDEKTFDEIEQAIENGNRLMRIKTADSGILLEYEVAGNIDEKRVYRVLDYDENSMTFGFGASINTLDSDFKEEQKERIEFGRDFKISKYIDDYNEASIALDDEGKLQFLLYDVESSFSYSSISPSGSKTSSNKILLFGKSKLYTNRSEMLKGRIRLYGDAERNFKANQNIDDIEIYSMDIKSFSTPIELDVKNMRDLKNKYLLKELSVLDLDEYTEYERPILFEEQDSKIHSIVFINSEGDGIKGHFEGEQEFVDVSGNSYKIDEKILYGEESYFTEDFIDKYENEFEVHLIKDKNSDTYFAEITKATLKKSEMKTGIFIINDIDDGETEFISDDGRYFNLIEEETEQVVLDKLYNDFSRSDMVKLKYQIADRRYIIIEEIELVYEPFEDSSNVYEVEDIDGLNIILKTGTLKSTDGKFSLENEVIKEYRAIEGASVFRYWDETDLSKGDYVSIHLNESGNIDVVYVLNEDELEGLVKYEDVDGEYLIIANPRINSELDDGEMEIENIENGQVRVIKGYQQSFDERDLGTIIGKEYFLDHKAEDRGKRGFGFIDSRIGSDISILDRGEKLSIAKDNLIKCYYNGEEVKYDEIGKFDMPELCKWTEYNGKIIYIEIYQIAEAGTIVNDEVIKIKSGDVLDYGIERNNHKILELDLEDSHISYVDLGGGCWDKGIILYTPSNIAFKIKETQYQNTKIIESFFESSDSSFDEYGIKLGQEMDSLEYDDTKVKEMDKNRGFEDGEFWIIECTSEANSENIKAVILENDESKIKTDIKLAENYIVVRAKEQLEKGSDYYMTIVLEDGSVYKSNLGCVKE